MKNLLGWWWVLGLCALGAPAAATVRAEGRAPAERYQDIVYPALRQVEAPKPERYTLTNGLTVFLLEDHRLPLVNASALIRVGSRWEPLEKAGLAELVGSVMRSGGTATHPGDPLDEQLDRLGATVETGIGESSGEASLAVLKEDTALGLTILADLLRHPAFPEDKLELAKLALRDAIERRNDDPETIAEREFRRLLYGRQSAYGHQPELKSVQAIRREDCLAFHRRFFQPESVVLGVWGDFNSAEMKALIAKTLGDWPQGGQPRPTPPANDATAARTRGVFYIPKTDLNQSYVQIGHVGGRFDDPDYFALEVMNGILGDGFSSRLFGRVRTDLGLAYDIGSAWAAGWDREGLFVAAGSTKSQSTAQFVEAIRREIRNMTEAEVSDAELGLAKDNILKGFVFKFDAMGKVVTRLMAYEYYGYPAHYLKTYQEGIARVARADVLRVAKRHLKPENLAIVVLGNARNFDKPLSSWGVVTEIDIAIPKE